MKKPRRSERLQGQSAQPDNVQLPSPVTRPGGDSAENDSQRVAESASPQNKPMNKTPEASSPHGPSQLQSPPTDTQPFSQFITPAPYSYEVEDEEAEGVWGYLVPLDGASGNQQTLVLKRRSACPLPKDRVNRTDGRHKVDKKEYLKQEDSFEKQKTAEVPAGGYLLGRHPECGRWLDHQAFGKPHESRLTRLQTASSTRQP